MSLTSWLGIHQRPEGCTLTPDQTHKFRKGLRFAGLGLGDCVKSKKYHDSGLFGNHGTLTNMDPSTDWVFDTELGRWATYFDNTNAYVNLTGVRTNTSTWWCSFWWYDSDVIASYVFDSETGRIVLGTYVSGTAQLMCYDGSFRLFGTRPSTSTWHHYLFQTVAGSHSWYVDGSQWGATVSGNAKAIGGAVALGARYNGASDYISGRISDLIIGTGYGISFVSELADRSNVLLSGLIVPPGRRSWPVAVVDTTPDLYIPHHGMMV